jgi:hypothetical protein
MEAVKKLNHLSAIDAHRGGGGKGGEKLVNKNAIKRKIGGGPARGILGKGGGGRSPGVS